MKRARRLSASVGLAMGAILASLSGCALSPDWTQIQGGTNSSYDQLIASFFDNNSTVTGAYYPLTDAPGSTGVLNALTMAAAPLSGTGVAMTGKAASFNGSGGYIDLGTDFDFLLGTPAMPGGLSSFTLEAWVLAPADAAASGGDAAASGAQDIFGQGTGGSSPVGYNVSILGGGTSATVAIGLNGYTTSSGTSSCGVQLLINPGQGFYFVGEYDADAASTTGQMGVFQAFVNATNTNNGCWMDGMNAGSLQGGTPLYLGADPSGMSNFVGEISHVAIYAGVNLSPMEIAEHYAAGGAGP